jgi:hypothetical protein
MNDINCVDSISRACSNTRGQSKSIAGRPTKLK